jgi:hypothetical protein
MPSKPGVYLIDTDVVSSVRKRDKADPGVAVFFRQATADELTSIKRANSRGEHP